MTAPTFAGSPLQGLSGEPSGASARAGGQLLPPHRTGITRDALQALARTTTRTRHALASQAEERAGSRPKEA